MNHDLSIVWLRRDLRLEDHEALTRACSESNRIVVVFVFDTHILGKLKSKSDPRVSFIYESIREIDNQLKKLGSRLIVRTGDPVIEIPKIAKKMKANAVFFNEDYEPYAKRRDNAVLRSLKRENIKGLSFKDHVIFSGPELNKSDGSPYKMYTPYKNAWLKKLTSKDYLPKKRDKGAYLASGSISSVLDFPSLEDLGFENSSILVRSQRAGRRNGLGCLKKWAAGLPEYHKTRDFPGLSRGTSGLSMHLRFGTISIRECVRLCFKSPNRGTSIWLSELIWRDFYQMILDRYPYVVQGSFKKDCDGIAWEGSQANFEAWCQGRTGFPIVDAGMRQLNQTGWMHNRLRMIAASFLVKDLLVDWRKGEAYFAEKLLDFDLAANNGGWQWCASTGCDAQPYFRIFNPVLQSKKIDPECKYIKRWVPELKSLSSSEIHLLSLEAPQKAIKSIKIGRDYPEPIVFHSQQKMHFLRMYNRGLI
ncbi:MAG: deoxyribodipyrimidine photo-lyase [Bdellovibrionales bacterium]|nr:deoxyribodipyrimidine photo-lyase [Bdellovibrionales bacterium]